jgi:hypothetical protein
VSVSDCGGHGGDACLDVDQLGVEVFPGEGWRTNRGAKEAETGSEFSGEGRATYIHVVRSGRVSGDGVGDCGGECRIDVVEVWYW